MKSTEIELLKLRYPIQTGINNPILRQKSSEIKNIDDNVVYFSDILKVLMWEYDGVGLAAPQIGENIRMICVTGWQLKGKKYDFLYDKIMINPEIIYFSDKKEIDEEGCLSLPKQKAKVERSYEINVKYIGLDGNEYIDNLKGLNARIVQHEIDHLDGILFIDKSIKEGNMIDFKKLIKI